MLSSNVLLGPGGWYLEVYTDDDNASGNGENARIGRWYGSREEVHAKDPAEVKLYPFDPRS